MLGQLGCYVVDADRARAIAVGEPRTFNRAISPHQRV
jgi:hypothetical protein